MLPSFDPARPYGITYGAGPVRFVQDGNEFDMDGKPIGEPVPQDPEKPRRGRPPKNKDAQ